VQVPETPETPMFCFTEGSFLQALTTAPVAHSSFVHSCAHTWRINGAASTEPDRGICATMCAPALCPNRGVMRAMHASVLIMGVNMRTKASQHMTMRKQPFICAHYARATLLVQRCGAYSAHMFAHSGQKMGAHNHQRDYRNEPSVASLGSNAIARP